MIPDPNDLVAHIHMGKVTNKDVALALGWQYIAGSEAQMTFGYWLYNDGFVGPSQPPDFLGDIRATMAEIERQRWCAQVGQNVHHKYWNGLVRRVLPSGDIEAFDAIAGTPGNALLIALLRMTRHLSANRAGSGGNPNSGLAMGCKL